MGACLLNPLGPHLFPEVNAPDAFESLLKAVRGPELHRDLLLRRVPMAIQQHTEAIVKGFRGLTREVERL